VAGLKKEDFTLLDRGREREIALFTAWLRFTCRITGSPQIENI